MFANNRLVLHAVILDFSVFRHYILISHSGKGVFFPGLTYFRLQYNVKEKAASVMPKDHTQILFVPFPLTLTL